MDVNKNLLVGMMKIHGDTQADLAKAMNVSLTRFNDKLNERNGAEFNQGEIRAFKERYNASAEDIDSIFFAK